MEIRTVSAASSGPWIYAWENPGPPWVPNNWVIHLLIEETAHSVHPADVDGDGFVDIVALMPSQVMWWRNDGTPFDGRLGGVSRELQRHGGLRDCALGGRGR